jgi:hypothetical protein
MSLCPNIFLNNEAVALLQVGSSREAMEILRVSLTDLKKQFLCRDSCSTVTTSKSRTSDQGLREQQDLAHDASLPYIGGSSTSLFCEDGSLSNSSIDTSMDIIDDDSYKHSLESVPVLTDILLHRNKMNDDEYLSMYDRALLVSDDEQNREVLTAVILYNMALVNHGRGINLGRSKFIAKALKLYKLSLEVLLKSEDKERPVNLLLLAIFNNSAHIYSQFFNIEGMRQCLDCMRQVLSHAEGTTDSEDYIIFFMNALFTRGEELTLAPAA